MSDDIDKVEAPAEQGATEEKTSEESTTETEQSVEAATNEETSDSEDVAEPKVEDEDPNFKWYIAHVLSGYETRVIKTLKENIVNHKKTEFFADIVVPEEQVVTNVNGKKRNIKKKFFPGYMLIKMIMNNDTWHLVKNTDKITGFVGGSSMQPLPITKEEAAYMLGQAEGGIKKAKSTASYNEGDSVKVIEGPFASFVGTVEAVNQNGKLKVNVSIFGRPTPVELDDSQVEKA